MEPAKEPLFLLVKAPRDQFTVGKKIFFHLGNETIFFSPVSSISDQVFLSGRLLSLGTSTRYVLFGSVWWWV